MNPVVHQSLVVWPSGGLAFRWHLQEARDCHAHVSATEPAAESGIGSGPACMPACVPACLQECIKQVRKLPADFLLTAQRENLAAGCCRSALPRGAAHQVLCPDQIRGIITWKLQMGAPRVVESLSR